MAKRKHRTAARNPNFTAAGNGSSMAAPKESQIGPSHPSTPPLPESSPKSKFAADSSAYLPSATNLETLAFVAASSDIVASDNSVEVVNSRETEDLKIATESEKQRAKDEKTESFQKGASVPNDSQETKKKPEENPDSPLPLTCITRILMGIPQCPHFLSLRHYSGIVRGQLESAWEQAFIETANRIQGLKSKDFWVNGIELWKATAELQTMGYDLVSLRRRLLEVTDAVLELEQSERKVLHLIRKAAEHRWKRLQLEENMQTLIKKLNKEDIDMANAVEEAERIQSKLPKYDALISKIAKRPFGPDFD